MELLAVTIPALWADHHVLALRQLLQAVPGVAEVTASAAQRNVRIAYDASQTDPARITSLLTEAGYPPGEPETNESSPWNKPAWAKGGLRSTTTYPADLSMSGDYRKY